MIFDAVVDAVAAFLGFVATLLDFPDVPAVVTDVPGYVATVGGWLTSTGAWVPWPIVATMVSLVSACMVAGLLVRLVRIVASFMTAGGES